jgi:long-chain acyl-CoA synthetase
MYGQTESGGIVCTHRLRDVRYETVGRPIPGVEIKISEKGEILIKSPGLFEKYHKMSEETSRVITDGWFYSGDCGIIEDGHLVMIDRMQDVMQLIDGTKYSPSLLENKLKFSPYIREAIVFGQDRPYIIALIQIDYPNVGNWAEKRRIEYTTFADLVRNEKVYELIEQEVKKVNGNLPSAARIRKFFLLKKELDADDEELTRTQKIRRKFVSEKYKEVVEDIYNGNL